MNHLATILVVDDDPVSRELLRTILELEGFEIIEAADGTAALGTLRARRVDLVLLDLRMPGISGFDLLVEVTALHKDAIVVVSAVDAEHARVRTLDLGADDFILKPATAPELVARVRAVLRRSTRRESPERVRVGDVEIDAGAREVRVRGELVEFTAKEFDLLTYLANHPGRVFTRHQLLVAVWQSASQWQGEATVTEHVRRVRTKIEADAGRPARLVTVRGVGYRFERRSAAADDSSRAA